MLRREPTPEEAQSILRTHFGMHPPRLTGTLHFTGEWAEDDDDYLLVWGAREFIVEGRDSFARWDNLAYFVSKQTGEVWSGPFNANFRKIKKMIKHRPDGTIEER